MDDVKQWSRPPEEMAAGRPLAQDEGWTFRTYRQTDDLVYLPTPSPWDDLVPRPITLKSADRDYPSVASVGYYSSNLLLYVEEFLSEYIATGRLYASLVHPLGYRVFKGIACLEQPVTAWHVFLEGRWYVLLVRSLVPASRRGSGSYNTGK
jgi:hypothetical protein